MTSKVKTMCKLGSKFALLIAFLIHSASISAQIVDDFDLGSSGINIIQLRAAHRLNGPMPITIDHGQANKGYNKAQVIKDNNGEQMKFNSIAHALQIFEDLGWKQEDSYVVVEGDTSFICFVLRRDRKK